MIRETLSGHFWQSLPDHELDTREASLAVRTGAFTGPDPAGLAPGARFSTPDFNVLRLSYSQNST
jgi:hypothetical protein